MPGAFRKEIGLPADSVGDRSMEMGRGTLRLFGGMKNLRIWMTGHGAFVIYCG